MKIKMRTIVKFTTWLACVTFTVTSCSKEKISDKEDSDQCWYKITLEGQTTNANQFGQDHLLFSSLSGPDGKSKFILSVGQAKPDGQLFPALDLSSEPSGLFNSNTAAGTSYSVDFATALDFNRPDLGEYAYRMDSTPEDGVLTVNVLENSEQRIRFKVSGTIMKTEGGVENMTRVKLVPIDAEFSFARSYYTEMTSNGVFVASANCECEE